MHANRLWSLWQALVLSMALGFRQPRGRRRFVEWVTGLALNGEEHPITQSLIGLDRVPDWKALESFAEYGHWNLPLLQWGTAAAVATVPNHRWYGYHVWAGDDTKVHRSSPDVWGTCTFHAYTARCPNRASTVRAHNWVVLGALLPRPEEPALFLPMAGRLYFRKSPMPTTGETCRTKCDLLVDLVWHEADALAGPHLAVFDGGFALRNVVRPLVRPTAPDQPRIEFITRLRCDARLCRQPPPERRPHQRGPLPKWGRPLPPPRQGGRWPGAWQEGELFLYGRRRHIRWKEVVCLWRVLGHDTPIKAVGAAVEGLRKRLTLGTSAVELTGLPVLELFGARSRQEDGFRDLKQRLGWEECRAGPKNPIERTTQALFVTLTALRLLQLQLTAEVGSEGWLHPPWNQRKTRPSVLDVERLLWQERAGIQQWLAAWLEEGEKTGEESVVQLAM